MDFFLLLRSRLPELRAGLSATVLLSNGMVDSVGTVGSSFFNEAERPEETCSPVDCCRVTYQFYDSSVTSPAITSFKKAPFILAHTRSGSMRPQLARPNSGPRSTRSTRPGPRCGLGKRRQEPNLTDVDCCRCLMLRVSQLDLRSSATTAWRRRLTPF